MLTTTHFEPPIPHHDEFSRPMQLVTLLGVLQFRFACLSW